MSKLRSIHWYNDEWENLIIDIYEKPQSNEDKKLRKDWREIYHISESNFRELDSITKFLNRSGVIEINGGQRVVIPSTEESKLDEWNKLCEDLIKEEVLIKV
ncbi:MAG: hypothetical protein IH825_04755 [Candidatus Marinimicrobia bacterium]|nr:hypothetical protein [Candidatus Neomarinimicrobiota bacterium]